MANISRHFNFSYPFVKKVIRNLSTAFESQYVDISAIAVLKSLSGEIRVEVEAVNWQGKNILEVLEFHELDQEIREAALNHAHYIFNQEEVTA